MYLAQQGAKIVIIGRSQEEGDALVSEIKKQGGQAMFAQADVTDKAMLEDCKKQVLKNYGKIDILINAAGGNMPGATIAPSQTIFDLNIDGLLLSQDFIQMRLLLFCCFLVMEIR